MLNGKKLAWHVGITFFAFKTPGGKFHIAISHGSASDFHMQINEINLSDYIKKNHPAFMSYLDHESMAAVIHAIKPDIIKKEMNREEFEFSGRMWQDNGKNYLSFWNSRQKVEKNRSLLDRLMSLLKIKFENSLFEFPQNQGDYRPYDQIGGTIEPPKQDMSKFMSQLHTLPPGAKKWAMRGLSMKEALLSEDPDSMYDYSENAGDEFYSWESENVSSVFSIFYDFNETRYIVAICSGGNVHSITTGDDALDKDLELEDFLKGRRHVEMTHDALLQPVAHYIGDPDGEPDEDIGDIRSRTAVSGRSWKTERGTIFSFWNRQNVVQKFKKQMDEIMNIIGANPKSSKFESIEHQNTPKSYQEFFDGSVKKSKLSDDQIRDLMRKQHLDPRAKKILHILANKGDYADSMKSAAASMNITVAQLKNRITQGD
jgi:hypothetical protein